MTQISKQDFLSLVSKSRVIEPTQLERWLSSVQAEDATEVANKMVRDQLLTAWQAKYLLTGRTRLDIGGYRLLERIQRDELGDRFLAIHKQLGRKVDIQVLPANLTHDKSRCEVFIKKASQVAKLDHPHLSHVYDIDQEGGRYFLVTEHVDGVRLAETSRSSLRTAEVARFVHQALSGLQFAHEHHVTHGNLSQHDLIISREAGVKIQNLATSPLRIDTAQTANGVELDDVKSMAKIGSAVLAELEPAKDVDERMELASILLSLENCEVDSLLKAKSLLTSWLEKHGSHLPADISADEHAESHSSDFGSMESGGFDQPINSQLSALAPNSSRTSATKKTPQNVAAENDEDEENNEAESTESLSYFARLASENPVGLLATVLVVGLIFIAGSGYGAYKYFGRTGNSVNDEKNLAVGASPKKSESTRVSNSKPTHQSPPAASPGKATEVSLDDPDSIAKFAKELSQDYGPDTESANSPPEPVVATPPAAASVSPDAPAVSPDTAPVSPDNNSVTLPVVAATTAEGGDAPNSDTPIMTDAELPEAQLAAPPANAAVVPDNAASAPVTVSTNPAPSADLAEPFKNFPSSASLPLLDDQTEIKIADLVIDGRYLLGAELFMHPGISRSRMLLEMERDPADNQAWIVTLGRNAKDKKEPVAKFRKTETEFFFQWLPAAQSNKNAGYLQNCLIKLLVPDKFTWLRLRQPVLLEPMNFTADSLTSTVSADLEYLPNPENLAVEILPTAIPETKLSPALLDLENGIPGRILLKEEDENPFVWVQVGVEMKQKFKVRSDLVVLSQGRVQPVKSMASLNELAMMGKQEEIVRFEQYEIAKATKAAPGKGEEADKIRAQLLKDAEMAQSLTAQAIDYFTVAPKLLNQPIGIRVFLKMDGHEVEIARTKAVAK